jgi:ribosomal protein L16 Arg81 hydroxylase
MLDIFKGKDDYIADRQPFFGKLPFPVSDQYNWDLHMYMVDSHPEHLTKEKTDKMKIEMNCFHDRPSAPQFAKDIEQEMQDTFALHGNNITNIAFSGFGRESGSYPWHKDSMDVFLVQVLGQIRFRLEGFNNDEPIWFNPGDYVWIPRQTHHQILPHHSRVTFSFGVEGDPDPSIYF